ncbi:hypothetical protein F4782DRAFT_476776 [Xylaria castorea]|nr:hypothetical protein F4782DRAFT_476776 [Xylaria castorea]
MQQEIEERDKSNSATIQDWEDLGYISDDDGFGNYDGSATKTPDATPDAMEIDSTKDRRQQLEGFKAELSFNWRQAERAETLVGRGELSEFSSEIQPLAQELGLNPGQSYEGPRTRQIKLPEFTPNEKRDKPHAAQVRMNHMLGLEGTDLIFGAIEAY